jgi:CRP-like cAMP-binding protein
MATKSSMDIGKMYDQLRAYIASYIASPVPDAEFEWIKESFVPRTLRKKQYLLQEGEVSRYTGFVIKGALRQYFVDPKGTEHILRFAVENWWVGDRESFIYQTPSKYNIDALEDSELLLISNPGMQDLRNHAPSFVLMMQKIDERSFIAAQKRIHATISYTAEELYQDLIKTNPGFLQRFPQSMIASYLGITPETLSRVRRQAASNK